MIKYEYWNVDSSENGDVFNVAIAKEHLVLDRKARRKLYRSSLKIHENDIACEKLSDRNLEYFKVPVLVPSKSCIRNKVEDREWCFEVERNMEDLLKPLQMNAKERLVLKKLEKKIMTDHVKLSNAKNDVAKFELIKQGKFKYFIDVCESLPDCKYAKKPNQWMTSKIENDLKQLLEDKIEETKFTLEGNESGYKYLSKFQCLSDFVVPIIIIDRATQNAKVVHHEWKVDIAENDYSLYMKQLSIKYFDTECNKLEFLKFNISSSNLEMSNPKKNTKNLIWKLPNFEIRNMDWNPLKTYTTKQHDYLNTLINEEINQKVFKLKNPQIKFKKLEPSTIDLINPTDKKINSLNLTMNNPFTIGECSVISTTEISQHPTKSHEPTLESNTTILETNTTTNLQNWNTSLITHKRSYIDDELGSLLLSRKKKLQEKQTAHKNVTNSAILNFLDHGIIRNSSVDTKDKTTIKSQMHQVNFDDFINTELQDLKDRKVILNANNINGYQSTIQNLTNESGVIISEEFLSVDCDFVLNEKTCLKKIELELFFQLSKNGHLYYQETLITLAKEFKQIVLLITYRSSLEIDDKDIFWKINLFLRRKQFLPVLIPKDSGTPLILNSIKKCILMFTRKNKNESQDFSYASKEQIEILSHLNFNAFTIDKILKNCTVTALLDLILKNEDNEITLNLLTKSQTRRIKTLLASTW